jgi:hypothetical protein
LDEQANKQPNHPDLAHYLIHDYDFALLAATCVSKVEFHGKIAPGAPHTLHMPAHIYSILSMWDGSMRSNLASNAAAEAHGLPVAHQVDFLVYAKSTKGVGRFSRRVYPLYSAHFRRTGERRPLSRNRADAVAIPETALASDHAPDSSIS